MPSVSLIGEQLPNRVDTPTDGIDSLIRFRVNTVYNDTGGQVHINYAEPDCVAGSPPTPGSSTKRCYPVRWNPSNGDPLTDWFHKYVVAEVIETDRTGGAPDMVTRYDYQGGAAWRKTEPDGIAKAEDLTWSQWRGYGKVAVTRGTGQFQTTKTEHTFLRGLHGNPLPGGGTQNSTVTDSTGTVHTDTDELAGHELETIVYNGAAVVAKAITVPWLHETGSQTRSWGTQRSTYLKTGTTRNLAALAGGGWRETKTVNTYETTHGRLTQTDDLGDVGTDVDDRCVRTTYADNSGKWMYAYASRVETVTVKCATTPNRATQVLTDVRTWYRRAGVRRGSDQGRPDPDGEAGQPRRHHRHLCGAGRVHLRPVWTAAHPQGRSRLDHHERLHPDRRADHQEGGDRPDQFALEDHDRVRRRLGRAEVPGGPQRPTGRS